MSTKMLLSDSEYDILYTEYHKYIINCISSKHKPLLKDFFESLRKKHSSFENYSDKQLSNKIIASRRIFGESIWPNIHNIDSYLTPDVIDLIEKGVKSSLLAVEIYNKPTIKFRSEGYIVLMMIAWTSLFHAIFLKDGLKIKYKCDSSEEQYFDLRKCINVYSGELKNEIKANLLFLIEIRDKIVHRSIPELDETIFGECQACLLNFENIIIKHFGNKYKLNNTLAFSIQFSNIYPEEKIDSIKKYHFSQHKDVIQFINEYRDNLDPDVFQSQHYSFRVFMIPKVGNHLESSDLSVEFIKYDPNNANEYEQYEKLLYVIKEKRVSGDYYKAGEIAKIIYNALKDSMPKNWKFNASSHHARCAKYFKIREGYYSGNPTKTNPTYCIYDKVFHQHIYTKEWIAFLKENISTYEKFEKIIKTQYR